MNIVDRAKDIILRPKETWEVIALEPTAQKDLIMSYILPLAIIPAIASLIGYGFVGINLPLIGKVSSVEWGLNQAITSFSGTFLGIFISGWIISLLAPSYNTKLSMDDAIKLVAYSYTPSLIAGVLYLIPALSIIAVVAGIYGLYILYLGFKPISKVADDKAGTYFVVSLLLIIVVFVVLSVVLGLILAGIGLQTIKY